MSEKLGLSLDAVDLILDALHLYIYANHDTALGKMAVDLYQELLEVFHDSNDTQFH